MRHLHCLFVTVLLCGLLSSASAQGVRDTTLPYADVEVRVSQVELTDFPIVRAFVAVTDSAGFPRTKLGPENFIVTENAIERTDIRFADRDDLDLPLAIEFVVDTSGSMQDAIDEELNAIRQFVGQLTPEDRVGLVTFADSPMPVVGMTNDHGRLLRELDFIAAGGQTALWDAVLVGIEELLADPRPARRAMVVLSDGLDNQSNGAPAEIMRTYDDEALAENIAFTIYALGLGTEIDRNNLTKVAGRTGGLYYDSPTEADLAEIYEDILTQIQSEYLIEWDVPGEREDGLIVDLSVDVTGVRNSVPGAYTYRSPGLTAALARAILPGMITISILLAVLIIATIFKATRTTWMTVMITPLEGKDCRLGTDNAEIGSTEACAVCVARDPAMLPVHAIMRETTNGWELSVTDPASPIISNGKLLAKQLLRDGDRFVLGTTQLVFHERINRPGVTAADQIFAEDVAVSEAPEPLTEEAMLAATTGQPASSPTVVREAPSQLVIDNGPGAGQVFPLKDGHNAIGRTAGDIVLADNSQASRSHCSITLTGGEATLTDPGSTNGTQVNGRFVTASVPQPIFAGDLLSIGEGQYRLE